MEPVIILELNHFANLCGHFYNAEYHDFSLPNCNNGYNCNHPEQEEGTEVGDRFIKSCYGWSCPLGYPPDQHDGVSERWESPDWDQDNGRSGSVGGTPWTENLSWARK